MTAPYSGITFPDAQSDRPYVYIDMVTTIDGKILSGERDEHVIDLGSAVDHEAMQTLSRAADAVLVGAATLRTTLSSWNPRTEYRVVVTRSAALETGGAFFSEGKPIIAVPKSSSVQPIEGVEFLKIGDDSVDLKGLLLVLRQRGVERLLVLGGSELNAQMLRAGLVDELFITIAPKVKLGRDVPTYADGVALTRDEIQKYKIVEHWVVESEIFVRYRRVVEA